MTDRLREKLNGMGRPSPLLICPIILGDPQKKIEKGGGTPLPPS